MKKLKVILILIFASLAAIWLYLTGADRRKRKREIEEELLQKAAMEKAALYSYVKSKLSLIAQANLAFEILCNPQTGYFTNYKLSSWKSEYKDLFSEINGQSISSIELKAEETKFITLFKYYFNNSVDLKNNYNREFVKKELREYGDFFDNIEGRRLDMQQRTSIVIDEDNNIVIAGAGSGKTTTIVGKVNYVIDRYKVKPEEILLISFTKNSATTLAGRINIQGVEAKTFHKFGKDVIANAEGKQPGIFDENQFRQLLTGFFEVLTADSAYLEKIVTYFTEYLKIQKGDDEFKNRGEYIQYLKDENIRPYKEIQPNGRDTFHREVVKSIEECKIANFLLFHNVDYKYEKPYEYDTATPLYSRWKPDFTITQGNKTVYLEHFAINRNNDIPRFFQKEGETYEDAKKKYLDKIEWARETNRTYCTVLIESYSYEFNEGIVYDNLSQKLEDQGIVLQLKSQAEIWGIISKAGDDEVKNLISLFSTFISLMKSNNYSITEVISKNNSTVNNFISKRNKFFIDIVTPVYNRFQNYLSERDEIDFNDMINKATQYIRDGKYSVNFKYVIIDEFQDISIGRYELIKAIKFSNPPCKLFCVGDDWQSIYRFSGSDIALFKQFENYFGYTYASKIETTYRFNKPLITLTSDFIQRNPNQAAKALKGTSNTRNTDYKIVYSKSEDQDDTLALLVIFQELIANDKNCYKKEIIILGRYGFDLKRIKNKDKRLGINMKDEIISYNYNDNQSMIRQIEAKYLTVHKSKGLEANIIIILNCNSGKYGFPSGMSDDPVLNLLLSEADQFQNGEERRLFYVAMTRAKDNLFFIADSFNKSKFIAELEVESGQMPNKKCPNCKTADIVLRREGVAVNGNRYRFYGCTNFLYGCDYQIKEWDNNR